MAILTTPSNNSHPQFRTTLSTVIGLASRLPLGRRQQRASTALLVVFIFFAAFTYLSRPSSSISNVQSGNTFIRPTFYFRSVDEPNTGNSVNLVIHEEVGSEAVRLPAPRVKPRGPPPPLVMDREEELAAVIHFITALSSNAITGVDPSVPVPAELLLGFNTRNGDRARSELDNMVQNTWFEHPVVIFSEVSNLNMMSSFLSKS